jgi:hypothetical protein
VAHSATRAYPHTHTLSLTVFNLTPPHTHIHTHTFTDVNRDSGVGVIEFAQKDDMKHALKKMDGAEFNGKEIRVELPRDSRYRDESPVCVCVCVCVCVSVCVCVCVYA